METKKVWETPTIKKLSMHKQTQNTTTTSNTTDGGGAYTVS